jgi:hypothetical protein
MVRTTAMGGYQSVFKRHVEFCGCLQGGIRWLLVFMALGYVRRKLKMAGS